METVVLVSVLSTLGVVALVTSIVVAFIKLKKKVDVEQFVGEVNGLFDSNNNLQKEIYNELERLHKDYWNQFEKVDHRHTEDLDKFYREMDSRLDKINHRLKQIEEIPDPKTKKKRDLITG